MIHYALQDIHKNDVVCFSNNGVYPIKTQESFLLASPHSILNSSKSYKKGDPVPSPISRNDSIQLEAQNIKKLIRAKSKAIGENRRNLNKLLSQKVKGLNGEKERGLTLIS